MNAAAMLFALTLLAAPTPKETPPHDEPVVEPTGPAPRVVYLKPDGDGKTRLAVNRPQANAAGVGFIQVQINGAGAQRIVVQNGNTETRLEPGELKELKVTMVGGKEVDRDEALRRLATPGYVIVSADGKAVSPGYLKLFRNDVLVLVSPDLVAPAPRAIGGGFGVIQGGAGGLPNPPRAVPLPAPKNDN